MAELDAQPKSIQSLYTWYSGGLLWVNRRYQRKLVWTLDEKQRLIESVLKRYPMPAILLAQDEEGRYEVIDGLQRLHTLMSFIETAFSTKDGRYFAVDQFVSANNRASEGAFQIADGAKLDARESATILDYSVALTIMRDAKPSEIDDVFGRINTYGHRLSDQERRQAGVQNGFSTLVRQLSSTLRGDASSEELQLSQMPAISIDLPKTRHGYQVDAGSVFWVKQGILRATDLRDSMDEQIVADIVACMVSGAPIARSKDALDAIYAHGSAESNRVESALKSYGTERVSAEFKFVLEEIETILSTGDEKLRGLLFKNKSTNPFPALFSALFLALHDALIGKSLVIVDYEKVRRSLNNLNERIPAAPGATTKETRAQNIASMRGIVEGGMVPGDHKRIYGDETSYDIDIDLMGAAVEWSRFEFKQGIARLEGDPVVDEEFLKNLPKIACAIANNGRDGTGKIYFGVVDRPEHAKRIEQLYNIKAIEVGCNLVVGVNREAEKLGLTLEQYVDKIRLTFEAANLSQPLKSDIASNLRHHEYRGLGVVIVTIPPQRDVSKFNDEIYIRTGSSTKKVESFDEAIAVSRRFPGGGE